MTGIEQTIITSIASVGFPIVVAWFLLTKVNKSIENNTKALTIMTEAFEKLCEKLSKL